MVNLLPSQARKSVFSEYRLRLAAVVLLCAAVACAISSALLLPAFFLVWVAQTDVQAQSTVADQSLQQQNLLSAEKEERSARILLSAVQAQRAQPRPSNTITTLTSVRSPGISVSRVSYGQGEGSLSVRLSGTAGSRSQLLAYKQALLQVPGVAGVDLPLDLLATPANIAFSLTVSYIPDTSQ